MFDNNIQNNLYSSHSIAKYFQYKTKIIIVLYIIFKLILYYFSTKTTRRRLTTDGCDHHKPVAKFNLKEQKKNGVCFIIIDQR